MGKKQYIWGLDKDTRLRILRSMIVPIDFDPLPNYLDRRGYYKKYSKYFAMPQKWYTALCKLCRLYGAKFTFDFIRWDNVHEHVAVGSFFYFDKKIVLYAKALDSKNTSFYISPDSIIITLSHELAHSLQERLYGFDGGKVERLQNKYFTHALAFEWEACRLSYYIYKEYFSHSIKDIHHSRFQDYRSRDIIQYLIESQDLIDDRNFPKRL